MDIDNISIPGDLSNSQNFGKNWQITLFAQAINEIKDDIKKEGIKVYVIGEPEDKIEVEYKSLDKLLGKMTDGSS